MTPTLEMTRQIVELVESARQSYERLVLVVGAPSSGKTRILREVSGKFGVKLENLSLFLAESLLGLPQNERTGAISALLRNRLPIGAQNTVFFDNTELLFETHLKVDPMRILCDLSREITLVVSWSGAISNGSLEYAAEGHPEHRTYPCHNLHFINLDAA